MEDFLKMIYILFPLIINLHCFYVCWGRDNISTPLKTFLAC